MRINIFNNCLMYIGLTLCTLSINAQNCIPVSLACPADQTFTASGGECGYLYTYTINTIGDCPLISVGQIDNSGFSSGNLFPIGVTIQSWASLDAEGNADTCEFSITVFEFPNPIHVGACNASINLSADSDCEFLIEADMILEGGPYGCYDDYIISITTLSGITVTNPITASEIGQTLIVSVTDAQGNSCWGYVQYEDYNIAPLQCTQQIVNCRNELYPSVDPLDSISFPIPSSFTINPATGPGPFTVIGYDNCGDVQLSFTDQIQEVDCTMGGPYTRSIYRLWTATDNQGNETTCIDTIHLRVPSLSGNQILPNRDGTDAPSILCSGSWDSNGDGIPQPEEIGDELNMNCDVWGQYEDFIHYNTCGVLILRSWNITNMCTGELFSFDQTIRLEDDEAPMISCSSELIGSTTLTDCFASYHVPHPQINDACSDVTYSITSSAGIVVNLGTSQQPHFIINNLPIGWHVVTYSAIDGCGNTAVCISNLHIEDLVPPTARCENQYTVHLSTGNDYISVEDIDTYSYDACGIAEIKIRRLIQGHCDGTNYDDLQWHEVEYFCCEDAGQIILIELGVWDIYGNFSSCISHIEVENNVALSLTCPPDITISCSFAYESSNLSIFGSVVQNASDVESIYIDDRDWVENCKSQNYNGPRNWGLDGLASSQCDIIVEEEFHIKTNCGRSIIENGVLLPAITREFLISNDVGEINSCIQNIYIVDCAPQVTQIIWPDHVVIDACVGGSTDPDDTGRPEVVTGSCDEIQVSFTDSEGIAIPDTCRHIERLWRVTSSCQSGSDSVIGEYLQHIYIIKSSVPMLTGCVDTFALPDTLEICPLNPQNSCEVMIDIVAPVLIDCDTSTQLTWAIDLDYDDSTPFESDIIGTDELPTYLPFGVHKIVWMAEDNCGNEVSCSSVILLNDCEPPIAVCDDIGIQIIQDTSGITILAEDIAGGSFDNCGDVTSQFLICDSLFENILLLGLVDNQLLEIDFNNGTILNQTDITNLTDELNHLVYVKQERALYSIRGHQSTPGLVKLNRNGEVIYIVDLSLLGETIHFLESITYDEHTDVLYASVSLDDSIGGGDKKGESLISIDRVTGHCSFIAEFIPVVGLGDMDKIEVVGNKLYIFDGLPYTMIRFYSVDLPVTNTIISPDILFEFDYEGLHDFAHLGKTLYTTTISRTLTSINTDDGALIELGNTHQDTDFNGDLITGLTFVDDFSYCSFANEFVVHCDDLQSNPDTFNYAIVVVDAAGNTDTCTGSLIVADTTEVCVEPLCELIYAINTAGQYYSIHTETGEFNLIVDSNVPTNTNAVAVNEDLGIGYFGSDLTVYWVDLATGEEGVVGSITVTGTLSAAAASYKSGYLYVGPETGSTIVDIFRLQLSADGKSFLNTAENISMSNVPVGNFGDFVVLEGGVGNEKMIMSIFNNADANGIWEYDASINTFSLLYNIASPTSSQITIDNVGNIWYFDNATNLLGMLDLATGDIINQTLVAVTISDMGRAWCPPADFSSTEEITPTGLNTIFAHPNPFAISTTIDFVLEKRQSVEISINTVGGIPIDSWAQQAQSGLNTFDIGENYINGTYIVRVVSNEGQRIGKIVKAN